MRREQRLTRPAEYQLVYNKGRSWADGFLVLKAMPNNTSPCRYGLSVGRKVGNAVIRNRVKRRLREIMRKVTCQTGWDIVLIARSSSGTADYWELDGSVRKLLARAGLLADQDEKTCSGAN